MTNLGQFQEGQSPWNKGKKASVEAKRKMSEAKLGKKRGPQSKEHKRKISEAQIGKKLSKETKQKIREAKKFTSPETRYKMRMAKLGTKVSEETKRKMSIAHKGKSQARGYKLSEETKAKMRLRKGDKSPRWKGGVTPINRLLRRRIEYQLWRESVFKRDDYTCVKCGVRGCTLNAHHIKPFATYPQLRLAIDNGETLCDKCHHNIHFYKEAN